MSAECSQNWGERTFACDKGWEARETSLSIWTFGKASHHSKAMNVSSSGSKSRQSEFKHSPAYIVNFAWTVPLKVSRAICFVYKIALSQNSRLLCPASEHGNW